MIILQFYVKKKQIKINNLCFLRLIYSFIFHNIHYRVFISESCKLKIRYNKESLFSMPWCLALCIEKTDISLPFVRNI